MDTDDSRYCDKCPHLSGDRCKKGRLRLYDRYLFESRSTGQLIDSDEYFGMTDDLTDRDREIIEAEWIRHIRRPRQCKAG